MAWTGRPWGVDPERRRSGSGIAEGDPRWRPARRGSRLHFQGPTAVTRSTRHVPPSPPPPAARPEAPPAGGAVVRARAPAPGGDGPRGGSGPAPAWAAAGGDPDP